MEQIRVLESALQTANQGKKRCRTQKQKANVAVLWIRNDFFRIRIRTLLFSWFRIRILFGILHKFFLLFLTKFHLFTTVFVRLLNLTIYKLVRDIKKEINIF